MTTIDTTTYRRDGNVIADTYRFAVHQAGICRHGKYESGYEVVAEAPYVYTPESETELALQALLSEIRRNSDSLRGVEVRWTHTTKDGKTIHPSVTLSA